MKRFILGLFFYCLTLSMLWANPLTSQQQQRADVLYLVIRCPVCDGQPLAGSEAELSKDLRQLIQDKIKAGQSDAEIKAYMVKTLGQDILLEPPHNMQTILLDYGVYALLVILIAYFVYRHTKVRGQNPIPVVEDKTENT